MVSKTQNKSAFRGVLVLLLVVVVIASAIQETEAGCSFKGTWYITMSSGQNYEKLVLQDLVSIYFLHFSNHPLQQGVDLAWVKSAAGVVLRVWNNMDIASMGMFILIAATALGRDACAARIKVKWTHYITKKYNWFQNLLWLEMPMSNINPKIIQY